jgi:hypothetical protein
MGSDQWDLVLVGASAGRLTGFSPLRTFCRQRGARNPYLVATNDIYSLLFAVTQRNRYGLHGAVRHICSGNWCRGRFRRTNKRRTSMCPIPRNIICARVMDVA